jgi:hypothetical protein
VLYAANVAQVRLNARDAATETLQRSRDDAFDTLEQILVAADGVVAIDQDLHQPILLVILVEGAARSMPRRDLRTNAHASYV